MKRFLVVALVLGIFLFVNVAGWMFYAANSAVVEIDLLGFMVLEVSVWKLALGSFGLGAGLAFFVAVLLGIRGLELRRRYRRAIRQLESEVHQLRSLPLKSAGEPEVEGRPDASGAAAAGGQG